MNKNNLTVKSCINSVINKMQELNYSEEIIVSYRRCYDLFFNYCNEKNYQYFNESVILEFLKDEYDLTLESLASRDAGISKHKNKIRYFHILGEYNRSQILILTSSKNHLLVKKNSYWNHLYDQFVEYLQKECDYKDSTLNGKKAFINSMMGILIQLNIHSIDDIDQKAINQIISLYIHLTPKSLNSYLSQMKEFFLYCYINHLTENNVTLIIPKFRVPTQGYIPLSWSEDEIHQLLDSIDRSNPTGKRDYAILLIACRLGLRGSDIINMQLDSFNWETKEIHLVQKKTQNIIVLPLLNDIGWAVIDYIKNGRPITGEKTLFLKINPPYAPFSSTSALTTVFNDRIFLAGLHVPDNKKCGIHSLRHTLGSLLLDKGTPLPVISQILGHKSTKSTDTYLRINMKGLEACPIDPDKVFNDEL